MTTIYSVFRKIELGNRKIFFIYNIPTFD